jgi:hypothetical protein
MTESKEAEVVEGTKPFVLNASIAIRETYTPTNNFLGKGGFGYVFEYLKG